MQYIALAYALHETKQIRAHTEWTNTKFEPEHKPKTIILLDEYGLDDQAQQEFKDVDDYLADAIDEYYQDTDDEEDYSEDYGSDSESDDY